MWVYLREQDNGLSKHLIEHKFSAYIIDHHWMNSIVFGDCGIYNLLTKRTKKNFYPLRPVESNYQKYYSVYKMYSIEFEFGTCIIDHITLYRFWLI